jgi:hypothetical protein
MSGDPQGLSQLLAPLSIREQAELALGLPPHERLQLLLHAPRPMRLVRALPDFDFYVTVREVGPADALPLCALASADQLHHLLDLESWRRDRFDPERSGAWVALFLEAGEPALRRFMKTADDALWMLLFQRWARATPVESPDDPDVHGFGATETGDEHGCIAPDGNYRFSPVIAEHVPALQRIAQLFFTEDPARYRRLLWGATYELPAEVEERALHWRESRIEEHGFPPREEALGVYAPPAGTREHPRPQAPEDPDALPAPRTPLLLPALRESALAGLAELPAETRERFLFELVALANHLLVADVADTGDPATHRAAMEKGLGYVTIALELRHAEGPAALASTLADVPLVELFREGYAPAVGLQARALRLPRGRFALDPPLDDRVAGLLEPRPEYAEIAPTGESVRFRPFRRLAEIGETATALELSELLARVLAPAPERQSAPSLASTLVLRLLAWHAARDVRRFDALPKEVGTDFLRGAASPPQAMERLTAELTSELGLGAREVAVWRSFARAALERLSAEGSGMLLESGAS